MTAPAFVGNFPFSQLFVMDMALSVCACVITNRGNSPMKDNHTWWHRKLQNSSWHMHANEDAQPIKSNIYNNNMNSNYILLLYINIYNFAGHAEWACLRLLVSRVIPN